MILIIHRVRTKETFLKQEDPNFKGHPIQQNVSQLSCWRYVKIQFSLNYLPDIRGGLASWANLANVQKAGSVKGRKHQILNMENFVKYI